MLQRTLWRVKSLPSHALRRQKDNGSLQRAGLFYGRYWARTSDPQLVDPEQRSRPFGPVRADRIATPDLPSSERTSERERTRILAILATPTLTPDRVEMSLCRMGPRYIAAVISPGTSSRVQAVVIAYETGLVRPGEA
jgi:hypothetical protein